MTELLIGDCHFGTHSNNISWLQHQVNFFNTQVYDILENKDIDRIVFLGDVFDVRYSVNTHIGIEVKKIFRHLLSYGIPVYVVAGNHDYYSPLKELQDYNAYELVFGEEFERAYKNLHIVKYDPLLVDGSLFLPWYCTEDEERWQEVCKDYKHQIKTIYCHSDMVTWDEGRLIACGNPTVYSGHIHYPYIDVQHKLYNIGACMGFNFNDVNSDRHLWIVEDGVCKEKIVNVTTPKFKRFYNEQIFDLQDSDMDNAIVQLCVGQSNVNKARYIEQIKYLKTTYVDCNIKVNVIDDNADIDKFEPVQFNTNIDVYIQDNIPDYLQSKYETIKEKMKTEI